MSLLIKNGKILIGEELVEKNILIVDDIIKEVSNERVTVDKVINASGKVVLPGIIDPHVHFREPGLTHKEDFFSGSKAAAAGGVTTVLDMPNTEPPTVTAELLEQKRELAKKSIVNYGFHFGATAENFYEIKKSKNIASVKIFMNITTGELLMEDTSVLQKAFESYKLITCHAEGENVSKALEFISNTKNKLYLCHISAADELKMIKSKFKHKALVEVCPHHLFLTKEDEKNNFFKMKPCLKKKEDQQALWDAIKKNKVNTIGSDHAPHTKEEKQEEVYGVPGVETLLPLLLDAVNKNRIKLQKVIELCCNNPAKIFKIKNKGFFQEGFDADLTIVDMNLEKEVKNENLFTKCKWSPFEGWKLKGWPVMTIVNGNIVFDNGNINDVKAKEIMIEKESPFKRKKADEKAEENTETKDINIIEDTKGVE